MMVEKIIIPDGIPYQGASESSSGTDVIVLDDQGKKYLASIFTFRGIEEQRQQFRESGEFLNGLYFWDKNMVLVEECTRPIIQKVVQDLVDEGEFFEAFKAI